MSDSTGTWLLIGLLLGLTIMLMMERRNQPVAAPAAQPGWAVGRDPVTGNLSAVMLPTNGGVPT